MCGGPRSGALDACDRPLRVRPVQFAAPGSARRLAPVSPSPVSTPRVWGGGGGGGVGCGADTPPPPRSAPSARPIGGGGGRDDVPLFLDVMRRTCIPSLRKGVYHACTPRNKSVPPLPAVIRFIGTSGPGGGGGHVVSGGESVRCCALWAPASSRQAERLPCAESHLTTQHQWGGWLQTPPPPSPNWALDWAKFCSALSTNQKNFLAHSAPLVLVAFCLVCLPKMFGVFGFQKLSTTAGRGGGAGPTHPAPSDPPPPVEL